MGLTLGLRAISPKPSFVNILYQPPKNLTLLTLIAALLLAAASACAPLHPYPPVYPEKNGIDMY